MNEDAVLAEEMQKPEKLSTKNKNSGKSGSVMQGLSNTNSMLAQVVGVIIGSPEFQRK